MSRKYSGEVPFTFCDLAACFSEEEWKLLNEWQKELYNNVMKEIQQAFNSLGPLIATSVFSLRPKENEDLGCLKHQDLDIKTSINLFSSDVIAESEALFKRNQCLDTQNTDERKSCEGPRKVLELAFLNTEVDAGLGDYECTRREESTMCYNSDPESTSPAPPVGIDIEGETYAINIQDYQRCPTGNGNKTRKKNTGDFVKHGNKSKLCKTSSKKDDQNVNLSICDEKVPVHQMWQRSDQELSGEKIEQWQRGYNRQTPSKLHPMTPIVETSDSYNKSESMLGNYNSVPCKSNLQQSSSSYSYPENKETCPKNSPLRHTEARRVKARYACTECGKSFPAISTLIRHERIHTGERPYQCTICAKSFNQKGALQRHQILHTGERPYQCNLCGKRFNLKHNLVGHQKIHTKIQFNSKTGVQELS